MVLDGLPNLYSLKYESMTAPRLPLYLCSYKLDGSVTASRCTKPVLRFVILRPSVGFVNPPTRLEPTSSSSQAVVIVAHLLRLVTLRSPYAEYSTAMMVCPHTRATASEAKREAPGSRELGAATASEGAVDSSFAIDVTP